MARRSRVLRVGDYPNHGAKLLQRVGIRVVPHSRFLQPRDIDKLLRRGFEANVQRSHQL
jgi:hypothetical protein